MCNCSTLVDEKLAARNTRLAYMFGIMPLQSKTGNMSNAQMLTTVQVATVKLHPQKRGNPIAVAALYCPFCGERLGSFTNIAPGISLKRVATDSGKEYTARIARHYDQLALRALASFPIERRAPSANFPLRRLLD